MPETVLHEQIRTLKRHQRLIWVFLIPTILFFNLTLFVHLLLVYIWIERSTGEPRAIEATAVMLVDLEGKPVGWWSEDGLNMGRVQIRPDGYVSVGRLQIQLDGSLDIPGELRVHGDSSRAVLTSRHGPTLSLIDGRGGTMGLSTGDDSTFLFGQHGDSSFNVKLTDDAGMIELKVNDSPVWHKGDEHVYR